MKIKTTDRLYLRIRLLAKKRRDACQRYQLARWLDVGIKSGHYWAYLMDAGDQWGTLHRVARMRRVSRTAQIKFDVAYEMLESSYQRSHNRLVEKMQEHYQQQAATQRREYIVGVNQ